jgi:hypothetical protein
MVKGKKSKWKREKKSKYNKRKIKVQIEKWYKRPKRK